MDNMEARWNIGAEIGIGFISPSTEYLPISTGYGSFVMCYWIQK